MTWLTEVSLAIIAGGKSSRMGRDKAFLKLGDKTLIERVITANCRFGTNPGRPSRGVNCSGTRVLLI